MASRLFPLACALALAAPLTALPAQQSTRAPIDSYTLPNGLKVVLAEDHSAPVVAVDVTYNVGSRNEQPGRTGFAHLFEHMMFEGSEHVAKGQHYSLLETAGSAGYNGSTIEDRTNYFEPLPSNRLNLGLWLEADRMRSLKITDENFHNQREAVKEERRLRVDNQPYTKVLFETSYRAIDSTSCYPYSHSIIGSMADLDAAQTSDVQAFFKTYYAPNNATLVVTGDFQPAATKQLIAQYFGDIPRADPPPPVTCNADKVFNVGARRERVLDTKATLPAVFKAYMIPSYDSPDYPALDLLGTILGRGKSSRLNRTLVRDSKLAVSTQTFVNVFGPRRGPGPFALLAIANSGVAIDTLDAHLNDIVAQIVADGLSEDELTKAKNNYRAGAIQERQRAMSLAQALQRANLFLGAPEKLDTDIDRYAAVTVADVKRAAATYLRPDNSMTFIISAEAAK
jgi:predicted Zn-dependent peptidase